MTQRVDCLNRVELPHRVRRRAKPRQWVQIITYKASFEASSTEEGCSRRPDKAAGEVDAPANQRRRASGLIAPISVRAVSDRVDYIADAQSRRGGTG